jgi:tripartite-type tricarboxylate transporter receptor subunit TctC
MKRYVALLFGLASTLVAGESSLAQTAQPWPARPVRIVNTFAAGGTADVLARMVADQLAATFRQQFFVETRAGATGLIGLRSVMGTEPDGYNLVLSTQSLLVTIPIMNPAVGYDPVRDLTNIAYVGGSPIVFLVSPSSGIRTFADFMARARASDRPLTYSSSGLGGNGHLMTEFFGQRTGVKVEHVPYKGASQGLVDLIGGHIAFSAQTVASAASYIRSGTLVPLANTADARLPDYPDLPTLKELGYNDLVTTTWWAFSGPAKLPHDVVERLNREISTVFARTEVRAKLERDAIETEAMSPEQLTRFVSDEIGKWGPLAKAAIGAQSSGN